MQYTGATYQKSLQNADRMVSNKLIMGVRRVAQKELSAEGVISQVNPVSLSCLACYRNILVSTHCIPTYSNTVVTTNTFVLSFPRLNCNSFVT